MWEGIPAEYRKKQFCTDDLKIYPSLIPWSHHWVCFKGFGDTNIAEGCNNYLRHRVSDLVAKQLLAWFVKVPLLLAMWTG
jgi:hypothetical protein